MCIKIFIALRSRTENPSGHKCACITKLYYKLQLILLTCRSEQPWPEPRSLPTAVCYHMHTNYITLALLDGDATQWSAYKRLRTCCEEQKTG